METPMAALTEMFQSAWWRRVAVAGFVIGFVGGLVPLFVR